MHSSLFPNRREYQCWETLRAIKSLKRTFPLSPTSSRVDLQFPFWKPWPGRVISRWAIRIFAERFPNALEPLLHWASATESSIWKTPGDVRFSFNSADFVEDLTVFDIGGNKYRLIAYVHYRRGIVYIKAVLTHKEYDKGAWKHQFSDEVVSAAVLHHLTVIGDSDRRSDQPFVRSIERTPPGSPLATRHCGAAQDRACLLRPGLADPLGCNH